MKMYIKDFKMRYQQIPLKIHHLCRKLNPIFFYYELIKKVFFIKLWSKIIYYVYSNIIILLILQRDKIFYIKQKQNKKLKIK